MYKEDEPHFDQYTAVCNNLQLYFIFLCCIYQIIYEISVDLPLPLFLLLILLLLLLMLLPPRSGAASP